MDDRPVGFQRASHCGVTIDAPPVRADKSREQLNICAVAIRESGQLGGDAGGNRVAGSHSVAS